MSSNKLSVSILLLVGVLLVYVIAGNGAGTIKESYGEYNQYCRWDSRRFCTLENGEGGKCVMNGLCVPQMLFYEGPTIRGTGWLSPETTPHSPVAPTWRWDQPGMNTLEPVGLINATETQNAYSNPFVQGYDELVEPVPPIFPIPGNLPETLQEMTVMGQAPRPTATPTATPHPTPKKTKKNRRRRRRRRPNGMIALIVLILVLIAVAVMVVSNH